MGPINVCLHVKPNQKTTQINRKSPRDFYRFQISPLLRFNSIQFNSNKSHVELVESGFYSLWKISGKKTYERNVFPFAVKAPTSPKLTVLSVSLATRKIVLVFLDIQHIMLDYEAILENPKMVIINLLTYLDENIHVYHFFLKLLSQF